MKTIITLASVASMILMTAYNMLGPVEFAHRLQQLTALISIVK